MALTINLGSVRVSVSGRERQIPVKESEPKQGNSGLLAGIIGFVRDVSKHPEKYIAADVLNGEFKNEFDD